LEELPKVFTPQLKRGKVSLPAILNFLFCEQLGFLDVLTYGDTAEENVSDGEDHILKAAL
jgi:hypothetical protein